MDSRVLHIAFRKALSSVVWDKHDGHEYILIGDGVTTDERKLQALIDATFSAAVLWLSMDRHNTASMPRQEAARGIVLRLHPNQTITATDDGIHTFLQVSHLGIARTGAAQSNYSFKRTDSASPLT